MDKQEYTDKKFIIEQKIDGYFQKRKDVEFEYLSKKCNDPRWIRYGSLIDKLKNEIQELKEKYYDDNMVYRTGERQLATRVDGSIVRAEGSLNLVSN